MLTRHLILLALAAFELLAQTAGSQVLPDTPSGLTPTRFPKTTGAKAGQEEVNDIDGLAYVWIPPGSFTMGCSPGDADCAADEKPAHRVTIGKGFWMGQTPVTQEAYQRVTGKSPGYFKGPRFPADSMNWDEAQSYCQATGMRLPTEAEWEYAARAGAAAGRYGDIDQIAWYGINSGDKTHEVMQKQPNVWRLYDMLGNVWEWTADWNAAYPAAESTDPQGPASGKIRVLRGGSWGNGPAFVRLSVRSGNEPENRSNVVGFRCVGN
jgi:formylglycine-generating enzyme required for sulfatase activity